MGESSAEGPSEPDEIRGSRAADVVSRLRASPVAIELAERIPTEGGLPSSSGFYAWWSREGAIPGVPESPHPVVEGLSLFYVGIAPRDEASGAAIRSRVVSQHLGGNTGSSTFRLTLAALLLDALDLHPEKRKSKRVLTKEENGRLSAWQRDHLSITWCEVERPWTLEAEVISLMQPPLNLADNTSHPFHQTLTTARAAFRAAARPSASEG